MDETFKDNPVQFKFYDVADKQGIEVSTLEMDEYEFVTPTLELGLEEESGGVVAQKAAPKVPELTTKNVVIKEQ